VFLHNGDKAADGSTEEEDYLLTYHQERDKERERKREVDELAIILL